MGCAQAKEGMEVTKFFTNTNDLNAAVVSQFKGNTAIKFTDSTMEIIEEAGIKFQVRILKSLALKPKGEGALTKKADFDPFMPPFEEGLFITELIETHRLIFNKFLVCKEHVICTTKDFQRQDSFMNLNDVQA